MSAQDVAPRGAVRVLSVGWAKIAPDWTEEYVLHMAISNGDGTERLQDVKAEDCINASAQLARLREALAYRCPKCDEARAILAGAEGR